nr:immunoglobulin heavy chain junction region [Macaca mulatta]MOX94812.1 immunoglobulin heavy chain junction region [Macaca mulatta]
CARLYSRFYYDSGYFHPDYW